MKEYAVVITVPTSGTLTVQAEDEDEAKQKAMDIYNSADSVVADQFEPTSFFEDAWVSSVTEQ